MRGSASFFTRKTGPGGCSLCWKPPFARIAASGKWFNGTHLGSDYAALLVGPEYRPERNVERIPAVGGLVAAVSVTKGAASSPSPTLQFSGYEWRVRETVSNRGGHNNPYAADTQRRLHPVVRDDIYRVAREAVRNAFRHAHAQRIEVDIRYDDGAFRLRVRDDGVGVDAEVMNLGGRKGHYGLPGMRERATRIGGHIEIWSELRRGREIEITIPGAITYSRH